MRALRRGSCQEETMKQTAFRRGGQLPRKTLSVFTAVCLVATLSPTVPAQAAEQAMPEAAAQQNLLTLPATNAAQMEGALDAPADSAAPPAGFSLGAEAGTLLKKNASAASGMWGPISWSVTDGVLTLTGRGALPAQTSSETPGYAAYASQVTRVVVSEGITSLGDAAFYNFYELQSVQLPSTLTSLGSGVFAGCYSLGSINLPAKLSTVGSYAFQNCAFQNVVLPASLTSLDATAFYSVYSLSSIEVAAGSKSFKASQGVLYSKDGKKLVLCPAGKTGSFAVPSGVTSLGENAFMQSCLQSITLPSTLKTIEDGAFCYADITSLALPNSVTSIGSYICEGCYSLASVSIGTGLKALGYRTFYDCSNLVNVNLGKVTDLDMLAFGYCTSLKKIVIPSGVKAIMNGTFGECTSLQSVTIPSTVKEIAYQAFLNCKSLTSIALPNGLEKIYRYAFALCTGLKTVRIPATVTHIGEEAFPPSTKMTNIPSGLTKMEDGSYSIVVKVAMRGKQLYSQAFAVLTQVNAERKKYGLPALTMDKNLLEAAMQRAMETTLYWSHTRPSGMDCFTVSSAMSGENIAAGQATAKSVMSSWMNSPGHRSNILGSSYASIGVGCVQVNGVTYWVQCFGEAKGTTASKGSYKDGNKTRTVYVSPEKEYYKPKFSFSTTRLKKKGATAKIACTWHNGFSTVTIPAAALVYKSSKSSLVSASKGVIKAKKSSGSTTVKVYFPGYAKGAVSKTIVISSLPAPTLKSAKNTKGKKITVSWKNVAGATGYQIAYSTNKNFKGAKNVSVKKAATTKKVVSKLKKGKTYYVKVRAYKTVKGKKQYTGWSKVKQVAVKK